MSSENAFLTLGIETSCDDTSAAVYTTDSGLASMRISSQMEHEEFGGVVPELASRAHLLLMLPVLDGALGDAGMTLGAVDGIAVTAGPGLVGSLLVGVSAAKGLALARDIPFIGVHHIEGHIYANMLEDPVPPFPSVVLVVSGGHTELVLMRGPLDYRMLGRTRDDAAGEAFDKVAKLLGLGYPGGPVIEREAAGGDPGFVPFPVSTVPDFEFSFSGLKTAVLLYVREQGEAFVREHMADILASFQAAVIEALAGKALAALREHRVDSLVLAGGVAANRALRDRLEQEASNRGFALYAPALKFCTDNAAMIAVAGHERLMRGMSSPLTISPEPRLPL